MNFTITFIKLRVKNRLSYQLRNFLDDTHWENCVLLNSVQELIEIEAWLYLIFLLCLQNQLISIHSIVTY